MYRILALAQLLSLTLGSHGGDYQQYMKQYSGGSQGDSQSQSGNYQQYTKKYAGDYQHYMKQYSGGSQGGSQSQSGDYQQYMQKYAGDYQHYMKQYAGGSQGGSQSQSGNYQKYMKQYAGGSQGGSQSQSGDYQKYMKQYAGGSQSGGSATELLEMQKNSHKHEQDIRSASDAQNKSQLNTWKSQQTQDAKMYVPSAYRKYAERNIDSKYEQRLSELKKGAGAHSNTDGTSSLAAFLPIINLAEAPEHKDHLNHTEREAQRREEAKHLHEDSEAGVQKAETLSQSLKKAAADIKTIDAEAAGTVNHVTTSFSQRSEEVKKDVANLQDQLKSGSINADFTHQTRQAMEKVKALRDDQLAAFEKAQHSAKQAAKNSARGAQTEVRRQAREVWSSSDRMARRDRSYEDVANRLQNRVEAAADAVEDSSDELARRTEDSLQDNLHKARDEVVKAAHRQFDTLHNLLSQATEQQKSQSFLAQSSEATMSSSASLASLAAMGVVCSCAVFFAKRNSQTVQLPQSMFG